jgi:hypothetical protein
MRKTKEIPKKNYFVYSIIFCFTLGLSLTIFFFYNNQKQYEESIPVLRGKTKEIEIKDVDEYLIENPNALFYVGVANDSNSRNVEDKLIDLINKNNLSIIYINLTNVTNKKDFYNDFNDKYSVDKSLSNYPAFIVMREGKVLDIVQRSDRDLYIGDIEQLIDIYEIKGAFDD